MGVYHSGVVIDAFFLRSGHRAVYIRITPGWQPVENSR
jgi:hypothetical protein